MVSEIKALQESLNVKKNNLNNKRLSRLQGVILKILAAIHPNGFSKKGLCRFVAQAYANKSVMHRPFEAFAVHYGLLREERGIGKALSLKRAHILNPKFSVSYSRSFKSLRQQGLIRLELSTIGVGVFITQEGLAKIQNRKVKVNAKFWDAFQASLKKEALGEPVPQRLKVTIEEAVVSPARHELEQRRNSNGKRHSNRGGGLCEQDRQPG